MGILSGLKIVEFEGLGPAPFCGMLLADLGAEVTLIARSGGTPSGPGAVFNRGKRSIILDLKKPSHVAAAVSIAAAADAVVEGLRPGVMERLGLGPDVLRARNRRLVYGRLTGWGQRGPLASVAGHDVNYVAISGAAWYAGAAGETPMPPPTLVGDVAGGSLYLAIGLLAAILKARQTGEGTIVDAAIVDGAAHMTGLLLSLRAAGGLPEARGGSMLDGAHFYGVYACADGRWISVGPLEPKFYQQFLEALGLDQDPAFLAQYEVGNWAACKSRLADLFAARPRDHWAAMFEGADACVAPVLSPSEAAAHPHMAARGIYREIDGVLHAAAAPRFGGETPADPSPMADVGAEAAAILAEVGFTPSDLRD